VFRKITIQHDASRIDTARHLIAQKQRLETRWLRTAERIHADAKGIQNARAEDPKHSEPLQAEKKGSVFEQAGPGNSPPFAPNPLNLERLTDQVVNTLNRRIIAQRERLGRF
jgi:hypothetical protein